ncbi:MAG: alpha/beta hydrolase [Actinobacteria bacterium]|nr:alpha/beta hydrolase [Actinomycetota bacterium]
MQTFTHDGLTIAYRDEGAGPAIVFLHNGGTSSTIWREQLAHLSETHRVVAVDLPGFGASPLPEPATTLDAMVELIASLIGDLGIGPVTLVGNCMGSNISVRLARAHPDLVTAVLAVNPLTAASFGGGDIGFTHRMKHVAAGPTRVFRKVSRRLPVPKFAGSPTLRFQLGPKGVAKGLHHDPELLACQFRSDQMPALLDVLDDMDAYGDLDTADVPDTVPIWIAWGEKNRVLSRDKASGLAEHLHAARVSTIAGTGHLPMLEDPGVVTGLIEDLIDANRTVEPTP